MSIVLAPDLHVLSDDALAGFAAREASQPGRDAAADIRELHDLGYLLLAVPVELGGLGGNLTQVCHQQRRLAHRAPAAALAVNEHLCWTGTASELRRSGNLSLVWLLEEAAAGEAFSGRVSDGESLTPLAWMQTTLAAITTGIAERGFELGVAPLRGRDLAGLGVSGARYVGAGRAVPELGGRRGAALMAVELEALVAHAERVTDDWSAGVAHGSAWPAKLAAARSRVADGADRIVATALDLWAGDRGKAVDELDRLRSHLADVRLAIDDTSEDVIGQWAVEDAGERG